MINDQLEEIEKKSISLIKESYLFLQKEESHRKTILEYRKKLNFLKKRNNNNNANSQISIKHNKIDEYIQTLDKCMNFIEFYDNK